jgi:hypothetical protein
MNWPHTAKYQSLLKAVKNAAFAINKHKGEIKMIIKKYAESNMDESCFYGKIEVETETKSEWEDVIRNLQNIQEDCKCVCHCNLKENAELIAEILHFDEVNRVFPVCIYNED